MFQTAFQNHGGIVNIIRPHAVWPDGKRLFDYLVSYRDATFDAKGKNAGITSIRRQEAV